MSTKIHSTILKKGTSFYTLECRYFQGQGTNMAANINDVVLVLFYRIRFGTTGKSSTLFLNNRCDTKRIDIILSTSLLVTSSQCKINNL